MVKSSNSDHYIPSLDGFRALSISIVFLGHSFKNLPIPGGLGVTIFFFISGYLITTLLLREFDSSHSIDFKGFYVRRLLRLMPPLLITMAFGGGLVGLGLADGTLDPVGLMSQIFFFYNYWDAHHTNDVISGLGILWSLSVEEHFYLIFPAIFILCLKKKWNMVWLPALAVVILVWRIFKFSVIGVDEWAIYSLTDTRIDSIIWGCCLAVLLHRKILNANWYSDNISIAAFIAGCGIILVTLVVRDDNFRSTIRYTLQGVALIPIFYYAMYNKKSIFYAILNNKSVRKLGVYSYTFYLVHYIILNAFSYKDVFSSVIVTAVVAGTLSIIYSAIMHEFVERPIKRWRQNKARVVPALDGVLHIEDRLQS